MPRFLRYEDALAWARGKARLTAAGLARGLDATPAAAASFLRRMEEEGVIGLAGPDGVHPVLGERRRRWAEAEAAVSRAAAAEGRLAAQDAPRERIAALRRLLARELHPDTAAPIGDPALQAAYAEVFKRVWPRIERVLDGEPEE